VDYIREMAIYFYGILTIVMVILCIDLLSRYYHADKNTRNDAAYQVFYILGVSMGGYGLYMIVALGNYFYKNELFRALKADYLVQIQLLLVMGILTAISTKCEGIIFDKQRIIRFRSIQIGLITFFARLIIMYLLFIVLYKTFFYETYRGISDFLAIPVIIAIVVYAIISFFGIISIFIRLKPQIDIRHKINFGLFWAILAGIGALIGAYGRQEWNIWFLIGAIIEVFGWLSLRSAFLSIPSYSEIEWRNGLIELHVILVDVGISLYYRAFQELTSKSPVIKNQQTVGQKSDNLQNSLQNEQISANTTRPSTDLIGGSVIGIKDLLNEIIGTKGRLKIIQIGDNHLIFNQGKHVLVFLHAKRNLGVYHGILFNLAKEIEIQNPKLLQFNGDINSLIIAPIVDQFFGQSEKRPR
jgi:hypothetical protein